MAVTVQVDAVGDGEIDRPARTGSGTATRGGSASGVAATWAALAFVNVQAKMKMGIILIISCLNTSRYETRL